MDRNPTDVCILVFVSYKLIAFIYRVFWRILRVFYIYSIMLCANCDVLPFQFDAFYFSCLNFWPGSRVLCWLTAFRVVIIVFFSLSFSLSPLYALLAISLSCMAFTILCYIDSIPTLLRIFILNGC